MSVKIGAPLNSGYQEIVLNYKGRPTKLKLYYDLKGYLSRIEASGKKIPVSELLPLLSNVTLANVQTDNRDNIVIDALTQSAIGSRQTWESNYVETAENTQVLNYPRGTFFARGMRGLIRRIRVYVVNDSGGAQNLVIHLKPIIGFGYTYTFTVAVPDGTAGWVDVINRYETGNDSFFWNYDSLAVECQTNANLDVGRNGALYPSYVYYNGAYYHEYKLMIAVSLDAQNIGALPVSGILNNIPIPNVTVSSQAVNVVVPNNGSNYDTVRYGAGELTYAIYQANADAERSLVPSVLADGVEAFPLYANTMLTMNAGLITATSPGVTIGKWDTTNHFYAIILTVKIPFKQSLAVGFVDNTGLGGVTAMVAYKYETIS